MPTVHQRVLRALVALATVVGVTAAVTGTAAAAGRYGNDISFPQCGGAYPSNAGFGVVGVSDGIPYSNNPCLASEWKWAAGLSGAPAFYMNLSNPGSSSTHWNKGGPKSCSGSSTDAGCAYDYGWNAAAAALSYAGTKSSSSAANSHNWWLDIETANTWSSNTSLNLSDIKGALTYLKQQTSKVVGVYSTSYQWGVITGGAQLGAPVWAAGASSASSAPSMCGTGFTGKPVKLVQYPAGNFDGDYRC